MGILFVDLTYKYTDLIALANTDSTASAMKALSLILATLAATTTILPLAFAQEQEVFSVLDKDDIIMHAYTDRDHKLTFAGRFNGDREMVQRLPFTTNIKSIQVVYAQNSALCRFRYGTEYRASSIFGPSMVRSALLVPQAHMLECTVIPDQNQVGSQSRGEDKTMIGGGGNGLGDSGGRIMGDPIPESNQKTTFLKD